MHFGHPTSVHPCVKAAFEGAGQTAPTCHRLKQFCVKSLREILSKPGDFAWDCSEMRSLLKAEVSRGRNPPRPSHDLAQHGNSMKIVGQDRASGRAVRRTEGQGDKRTGTRGQGGKDRETGRRGTGHRGTEGKGDRGTRGRDTGQADRSGGKKNI